MTYKALISCTGAGVALLLSCGGGGGDLIGAGGSVSASGGSSVGGAFGSGGAGLSVGGTSGIGSGGTPGAGGLSAGGAFGALGGASSGGLSGIGGSGSGGAGNASGGAHALDHCKYGYDPDATDATMQAGPDVQSSPLDTWVQPEVIAWMEEREWQAAHFAWHRVRRCPGAGGAICNDGPTKGVTIPANQECKSDGDGYEFLTMHRHMIESLKQLWPSHTEMFEGFDEFPQSASDVPEAWRDVWSSFGAADLANAKIADEIDKPENYSRFADEGQFGRWLQCGTPAASFNLSGSGLHGSLHFKWTPNGNPPHSLGNQESNIDNYMFWKMHGWIDKVWEKYRKAIGKPANDPELRAAIEAQCREMDTLALYVNPNVPTEQEPNPGNETGFFHEQVRPLFEGEKYKCVGCHFPGEATNGALTLGGDISSRSLVEELVNQPSVDGGQFRLVEPGDASKSWLYLKFSGTAQSAGCQPTATATCNTGRMPPTLDVTASTADLEILRQWIEDHGAAGPP